MKKISMILLALMVSVSCFASQENLEVLHPDFEKAALVIQPYVHSFDSIADHYGVEAKNVIAMAFPEVMRYGKFQNKIEVSASRLFSGVSNYADFSIGFFQMRTICALDLEQKIQKDSILSKPFSKLLIFDSDNPNDQRLERIGRMEDPEEQFVYLCAFYALLENKYQNKKFEDEYVKINFYTAAYNSGPSALESKIDEKKDLALFPYGPDSEKSVRLGDAANYFLKNFAEDLFGTKPDISTGEVTGNQKIIKK